MPHALDAALVAILHGRLMEDRRRVVAKMCEGIEDTEGFHAGGFVPSLVCPLPRKLRSKPINRRAPHEHKTGRVLRNLFSFAARGIAYVDRPDIHEFSGELHAKRG